jgi:hypothetical protein
MDAILAPPLVADLVPAHTQTNEFYKKPGSTRIDAGKAFTKLLLDESLKSHQATWVEEDNKEKAFLDVFHDEGLKVRFLLDETIGYLIQKCSYH